MIKLQIIDPCAPYAYDLETIATKPMGGTEATTMRLARELSKRYSVVFCQKGRKQDQIVHDKLLLTSRVPNSNLDHPDITITLRDPHQYVRVRERHPEAKHYFWMHDIVVGEYMESIISVFKDVPVHFIFGSNWHMRQALAQMGARAQPHWKATHINNFVENDAIRVHPSEFDPYKLIFFSSPHKGLDHVLHCFMKLREKDVRYKLQLANPGYCKRNGELPDGVTEIGELPHEQLMGEIRSSLCTFYPNVTFPETFGLVYAESNAVGTPVLCHNIGAAEEVLYSLNQLIDCYNVDAVVDTVIRWTNGERPIVKVKEYYTIKEAIRQWHKFLNPMNQKS